MRNTICDVLVLKTRRQGDYDKQLILFSGELGLVYASVYGAYRSRSRLAGSTEQFTRLKAYLYHNPVKNSWKVSDAEVLDQYSGLRGSLEKIMAASVGAEIIMRTEAAGGEGERLYRILLALFHYLDNGSDEDIDYLLIQFLQRYIEISGSMPDLSSCPECGREIGKEADIVFSPDAPGFFLLPLRWNKRQEGARGDTALPGAYPRSAMGTGCKGEDGQAVRRGMQGDAGRVCAIPGGGAYSLPAERKGYPVRLFVAVPLEEGMRRELYRDLEPCRRDSPGIKWVRPEVMHITLVFLGEIQEGRLGELKRDLEGMDLSGGPFYITFGGLGRFPPKGRPRVFFSAIEDGLERLRAVHRECSRVLTPFGPPGGGRDFTPHLTLGRVRRGREDTGGIDLPSGRGYRSRADRIVLYRSILRGSGPEYFAEWEGFFS